MLEANRQPVVAIIGGHKALCQDLVSGTFKARTFIDVHDLDRIIGDLPQAPEASDFGGRRPIIGNYSEP